MKKTVQTDSAPKALGPYAHAIVANGMVYCAGQIPLDPKTGDVVAGGIADCVLALGFEMMAPGSLQAMWSVPPTR